MKNINKALTICQELIKQSKQLKDQGRRSSDWKIEIITGKLEILQDLLQDPNGKYEEKGKTRFINDV